VLLHTNLTFVTVAWCADLHYVQPDDIILHCASLSHGAGFHLLVAVARGAQSVLHASFQPPAVLEAVSRFGVTAIWLVPTQIRMLLDDGGLDRADLSSLQRSSMGARR
jgi:long-chain acyl-CoA synthetase